MIGGEKAARRIVVALLFARLNQDPVYAPSESFGVAELAVKKIVDGQVVENLIRAFEDESQDIQRTIGNLLLATRYRVITTGGITTVLTKHSWKY